MTAAAQRETPLNAGEGRRPGTGVRGFEFDALPDHPNPLGLGGPLVGVHGSALIVAGGANFPVPLSHGGAKAWHRDIHVLLPGSKEWAEAGLLPRHLAYASCASTSKGVLCVGGSDAGAVYAETFLMNWDSDAGEVRCTALPPLPAPSAFGAAEAIGDRVFVLGGKTSKDDADLSGAAWTIDLAVPDPTWSPMAPMPGPPRFKVVTALQRWPGHGPEDSPGSATCLYAFSGSAARSWDADAGIDHFTDGYRYSPSEDAWTKIADLPILDDPRRIRDAANFVGHRWPINAGTAHGYGTRSILAFSGTTGRYIRDTGGRPIPPAERPFFVARVLLYDTVEDDWTDAGPMPLGVVTTRAALWEGKIVIPSGEIKPGVRTPRVQSLLAPGNGAGRAPPAGPIAGQKAGPSGVATPSAPELAALDYLVLGLYLLAMVAIGAYFARRGKTEEEFFFGAHRIPWWAAGLSIFGTQLSAITFMAIPATAYGTDWRRFAGQLMLLPVLALVATCFLPVFRRLNVATAYEFLELRFSRTVRRCASGLFVLFQLARMGIVLFLPALAVSAVTGTNPYACIALMGVLATIYTAVGGISAVIWTDVVQVVVLIGGASACLAVAISGAGGVQLAMEAAQNSNKLAIFEWRLSTSDMVAWVLIVGFFFTNLVPYATDQTVVQRYLTTRNEREAAKSLWLNFAMTVPAGLLFFGLGTALWAYYSMHPEKAAALPAQADQLVPWFVVTELPHGVAGLVIAGILAAAMSSLDSSINSITAAIVNDFLPAHSAAHTAAQRAAQRAAHTAAPRHRMGLIRWLTVTLGAAGTLTAMALVSFEIRYLFDTFQMIVGFLGGGVTGVFLLGIFSRSINATGALSGLAAGGGLTLAVVFLTDVNFLLYAAVGTLSCLAVGWCVSYSTGGNRKDIASLFDPK